MPLFSCEHWNAPGCPECAAKARSVTNYDYSIRIPWTRDEEDDGGSLADAVRRVGAHSLTDEERKRLDLIQSCADEPLLPNTPDGEAMFHMDADRRDDVGEEAQSREAAFEMWAERVAHELRWFAGLLRATVPGPVVLSEETAAKWTAHIESARKALAADPRKRASAE